MVMSENSNKVICPYCGKEMSNRMMRYLSGDIKTWYECFRCGSRSPVKERHATPAQMLEMAKAAALMRYHEPQKPLTLEEMPPKQLYFHESVHWVEIHPCYVHEAVEFDSLMIPIATIAPDAITHESLERYGKDWRLWARYPSEDERKAAKWEDE